MTERVPDRSSDRRSDRAAAGRLAVPDAQQAPIVIGCALAGLAAGVALFAGGAADYVVLAVLAILASIGVFGGLAFLAGVVRFGRAKPDHTLFFAHADHAFDAVAWVDGGRVIYANAAYRRFAERVAALHGAHADHSRVPPLDRLFAAVPDASEAIYRLARAADQGVAHVERVAAQHILGPDAALAGLPEADGLVTLHVVPVPFAGDGALWTVRLESTDYRPAQVLVEHLAGLQGMVDGAGVGLIRADAKGLVQLLNATAAQWLGLEPVQAIGRMTLADLLAPDCAERLGITRYAGMVPDAGTPRLVPTTMLGRHGQPFAVRVSARADAAGGVVLAFFRDDQPADGPAVAASVPSRDTAGEMPFARFFHAAPLAIATVDAEGRILRRNAAFARMFDATASEPYGHLTALVAPECQPALATALGHATEGGVKTAPVDVRFPAAATDHNRTDRGAPDRTGRLYVSPVGAGEQAGEVAIIYGIDTTDQKALERQLAHTQKMQAVDQLAAGIAHDFNNVLTAIIGFSDLLLATHRRSDPAFRDIINIKQSANRAASLVRHLLAFSRQQTMRPEVLSMTDVVSEVAILLSRLIGEKIDLKVQLGRDIWPVKADRHQLEHVLINLAVNARDAMPQGGKLTIRTANVSERDVIRLNNPVIAAGEYVLIEVTDTGCGMSPEIMAKIFEPFFTTKDVGKGTGLGLSTVYGVVKQSGGYVFPESAVGVGTTFRIYLPRHEAAEQSGGLVAQRALPAHDGEEAVASEATSKDAGRDLTGSSTILVVEDEDAVRSFAVRALRSKGYEVLEAMSGLDALDIMATEGARVDLVLSDVVMPEMDGPTLLKELRKTKPDLRIIFMSGYAEDAFRKNLGAETSFGFLSKPFSLKQVAQTVKQTLEA